MTAERDSRYKKIPRVPELCSNVERPVRERVECLNGSTQGPGD